MASEPLYTNGHEVPAPPRPDAPQPANPPDCSWWAVRRLPTPVPCIRLSISLAGPAPSGSTGTSRHCQGCFHPIPAPPGSGCPQLQPTYCDKPAMKVSHLQSIKQRLTAHMQVGPMGGELQPAGFGGDQAVFVGPATAKVAAASNSTRSFSNTHSIYGLNPTPSSGSAQRGQQTTPHRTRQHPAFVV